MAMNICSSIGAWTPPALVICSGCQPAAIKGSTSAASPSFEQFRPARVPGVPEEAGMRYKVNGGAEMSDTSLVRARSVERRIVASPSLSMVRNSSVTLVSAAMPIPFERWSRFRRLPWPQHRRFQASCRSVGFQINPV